MTQQHRQRLQFIKPHLFKLVLGMALMVITVAIQLMYPKAIAFFMDNLTTREDTDWLVTGALIMALVFVIQGLATGLRGYLFQSTGHRIVMTIRQRLFAAILSQETGFFDKNKTGELANRIAMDVETLQDTLSISLVSVLRSALILVGGTLLLISVSPYLSLLLVIVTPCALLTGRYAGKLINQRYRKIQNTLAECSQVSYESISNVRLIQGFNRQQLAQKQYGENIDKALNNVLSCVSIFAKFQGGGQILQSCILLTMVVMGGLQVASGTMTVGGLTSFIVYATMVANAAGNVSSFWGEWMKTLGATERVFELLQRKSEIVEGSETLQNAQGHIRFSTVSFSYPTRPNLKALEDLDLTIKAGETIALVGASGSGKSTIARLILGHYQPQQGSLQFDGIEATNLSLASIRNHIAMVEQEPDMFSGSIMDNIKFAARSESCSDEDVFEAAKLASAHDFISAFPDGYNTQLGDKGIQLSGGQKQRVAIARALLRNPKILILDEATSALDAHSEADVQSALDNLMQNRTTIIIAHRLSTIAKAQRVLVMDKGRIIQSGSHGALIQEKGKPYATLLEKQMVHSHA